MRVRRAIREDAEALGRGMKEVVDEGRWLATESNATAYTLAPRFTAGIAESHLVFVLEDDGELAGSLGLHPGSTAGVLELGMWILPARRRQGGGRMLIEAAPAARPAEVHKIELEVFPDNDGAIALYEAMGFEREGLLRDHYRRRDGSLRSAILMARLFPDP